MVSISAALPAYNEEENVGYMIEGLDRVLFSVAGDYEIVIVDDGSKDRTAAVVREHQARYPRVRLIQHEVNKGFGAAVLAAFTSASKEWVFYTDSDRQFKLEELSRLVAETGRADMVVGYRRPRADPPLRRLYGWGWTWLCNLLLGYCARDIDCAFKLYRRDILNHIQIGSRGATFSAEFLTRTRRAGFRVVEVPVSHLPRVAGSQTGARLHVIARAFRELVRLRMQLWREGKRA